MSSIARVFAKPGWVITAVAVIAFAYVAFTVLAPWQLGKNARTSERNANIEAAFERAPVPAASVFSADGRVVSPEWSRVVLEGSFDEDPAHTVVVRLRPIAGQQAYQVLTPMRVAGVDEPVVVNRGYVPAEPGEKPVFAAPPSGVVRVEGFARLSEPVPSTAPVERFGLWQIAGLSMQQFGEVTGLGVAPDYVQAAADQPGVITAVPLPQLDPGPYLSYGIQWIAFGIMAPLGLLYFVRAEIRERRQEEADRAAAAAVSAAPGASGSSPAGDARDEHPGGAMPSGSAAATDAAPAQAAGGQDAAPQAGETRRRARYGQRRDHFAKAFDEQERF